MKAILEFLAKNNRWAIVLVLLLFIIGGGFIKIQHNKIVKLRTEKLAEVKLRNALTDTVHVYQNKEKEWVAEKLTIQATVKDLEKDKVQLTDDQKRLVAKVKEVEKENSIITAALVQANFIIDSLQHGGLVVVDTLNKTVAFIEPDNPDIQYDFAAIGVLPYPPNTKPTLLINHLNLPNEQFVEFHWRDQRKEGYPIAFSITNSNKYVKVNNINSYAIPELQKEVINPTGWEKVGQWFKRNGKIVGYVAGGVVVGAAGTYVIMK